MQLAGGIFFYLFHCTYNLLELCGTHVLLPAVIQQSPILPHNVFIFLVILSTESDYFLT